MYKHILLTLGLLVTASATLSSCAGLAVWQKGHYYKSEAMDSAAVAAKDVRTVGVYVFSDGEGDRMPYGTFAYSNWPSDEVMAGATFDPDTSNSGPSLEFANAIATQLGDRGYNAKAATDLGHSREITLADCLKDAKAKGYDGAFVAYYCCFSTSDHFVYFPNGGFFETKTGDQLWKSSYYGMVENAHIINLSGEPFVNIVSSVVTDNGDDTYIKAAPKAAKMLLDPSAFPSTTKPFPGKGERKHHM